MVCQKHLTSTKLRIVRRHHLARRRRRRCGAFRVRVLTLFTLWVRVHANAMHIIHVKEKSWTDIVEKYTVFQIVRLKC